MPRYLITILCLLGSTGLFFCFFSLVQWTNNNSKRQDAVERFPARLAAYPIYAFVVLLPYALKTYVPEELSDALFLASVILCRVIAFFINRFWVSNAINKSIKSLIYGFVLAFALITQYYEGWLPALPIFVYFLSFYIDFRFRNHTEKDNIVQNDKKELSVAIKRILKTMLTEFLPVIINCIVILLVCICIPILDNFVRENWIALWLPWLVLTSYYIFAVVYGKKRKKLRNKKCKNTNG